MMEQQRRGVAIVTGAARRIGAAIAGTLHARGLDVLIHCRDSLNQVTVCLKIAGIDKSEPQNLLNTPANPEKVKGKPV